MCFIVQGGAAIFCSVVLYFVQPRSIYKCSFLSDEEKEFWRNRVNNNNNNSNNADDSDVDSTVDFRQLLRVPSVWLYSCGWFLFCLPYWGFIYWTPTIIEDNFKNADDNEDYSAIALALIASIPYVGACIGNVLFAYSAQLLGNRLLHQTAACVTSFVGFVIARDCGNRWAKIVGLSLAGGGLWGNYGPVSE